jgi:fructokinase
VILVVGEALVDVGRPAVVAVTRGSEGSTAFAAAGRLDVPAPPVTVVDTVGAGDAYMAGLIAGLHREDLVTVDRRAALHDVDLDVLGRVVALATERAAWVVGRAGA